MSLLTEQYEQKNFWQPNNAQEVAKRLGYICNQNFIRALDVFFVDCVSQARMTNALLAIADGHFRRWMPPIPRDPERLEAQRQWEQILSPVKVNS